MNDNASIATAAAVTALPIMCDFLADSLTLKDFGFVMFVSPPPP
jgi:hypothetical protein